MDVQAFLAELDAWAADREPGFDTRAYGEHPDQVVDVRSGGARVAILVHGGFWRPMFTRANTRALAVDLALRGWKTWNVESRRWSSTVTPTTACPSTTAARSRPRLAASTSSSPAPATSSSSIRAAANGRRSSSASRASRAMPGGEAACPRSGPVEGVWGNREVPPARTDITGFARGPSAPTGRT